MNALVSGGSPRSVTTVLGHPVGLLFLVLTGTWEVVALFGMRTVLVLYLVHQMHFSPSTAVQIYGLSTGLSFLMSLAGGMLADRVLGAQRAVLLGAVLLALAHFLLIAPPLLFASLLFIAVGSGLFRPTLVALVVALYRRDDPRRPRALLLYKLGCQIGGIIGPIVCGVLYEQRGWTSAVTFCGVGMLVAAGTFLAGRRHLGAAEHATPAAPNLASNVAPGCAATTHPVAALLFVWVGAVVHWTVASQQGGVLTLWAYDSLDRTTQVGESAWVIPAAWFQSINPMLIICATPCIGWLWARGATGVGIEIRRMTFGSLFLAFAFVILSTVVGLSHGHKASWIWLAVAMTPLTVGEIYLDVMGQAMFSRLSPRHFTSTAISLWFITLAVGNAAAGLMGELWGRATPAASFALSAALALLSAALIAASRLFVTGRAPC